jgi:DNA-3-methyladenine glycosylase II
VLRASGFADAWLPTGIHRGATHTARFYGIAGELTPEQLAELAEGWRPFRTWALVLMRVAGERGTRL